MTWPGKVRLSRRAFLRGAGATVALPALEIMRPLTAFAQDASPVRRFIAWYVPNGIHMPAFRPGGVGTDWSTPSMLAALTPLREHVSVITGLRNEPAEPTGSGDHAAGTGAFLTCTHVYKTESTDIRAGVSFDQALIPHLAPTSAGIRLPSLQLGAEGGGSVGDCDNGYSCAYSRNISWASETTPLAKEIRAAAVFDRIFAGASPGLTAQARDRRKAMRLSILDQVGDQASKLSARLGVADRRRLDEYMTGLRDLERRIEITSAPLPAGCVPPARAGTPGDVAELVRQMTELTVLALQCDLTRVVSFMLANAASQRVYRHLDMAWGHHELSHHQGDPAKHASLEVIGAWEVAALAHLVGRLAEVKDPLADDAPLIDSTAVLWSSEISDGNAHNHDDLPVIVAGAGLGGGRHIKTSEAPLANLYLAIAAKLGAPMTEFGDDGTAPLAGI